jgi:hypothetical protein
MPTLTNRSEVKIRIKFPDQVFTVTLIDHLPAREFLAMLPLQLNVSDFASSEKIAYLPNMLTLVGMPVGTDAKAGDLAYYAPWGNLALFYKSTPYAKGLVQLGQIDDAKESLGAQKDSMVTIELA